MVFSIKLGFLARKPMFFTKTSTFLARNTKKTKKTNLEHTMAIDNPIVCSRLVFLVFLVFLARKVDVLLKNIGFLARKPSFIKKTNISS